MTPLLLIDVNPIMVFLLLLLLFALGFGLTLALLRLSLYWLQRRAARQFEDHFRDATEIMQWGRVPTRWVRTYRRQIEQLRHAGKHEQAIQRAGNRAQKQCLRQLDALIKFLENGRFYESLEIRELMVDALWAVHARWAASSWETLLSPQAEPGTTMLQRIEQ